MRHTVRVGVIGAGFGRIVHIPAFLSVQGATLMGVAAARYERAQAAASEFSLPRAFASWREMVECPEVDAVTIATPPGLHAEISLAACAAGKAVLCEKPMALDATQAATMLGAARSAGVVHFVGFEFREIPALQFAREIVKTGGLGRLRHASVAWIVQSWGDPRRPWSWRSERAQGGGALGALGVHVFDYVEWILGPIRALVARLATRIVERPDPDGALRPVTSEDCGDLLLELADGTPVTVALSMVARAGKGHWIELYGNRKSLTVGSKHPSDYARGFTVREGLPGSEADREVPMPETLDPENGSLDGRVGPFMRLAERFVDVIEKREAEARPSFEDGLRAQILLDAAIESQRQRRWVDVPPPRGDGN